MPIQMTSTLTKKFSINVEGIPGNSSTARPINIYIIYQCISKIKVCRVQKISVSKTLFVNLKLLFSQDALEKDNKDLYND